MTPQGSSLIDTTYLDNLIARAGAITVCSDLQSLATTAMASLQAHISALEQQIAALLPFQALLTGPTDLPSAITWIETFIKAQIAPAVTAYENAVAQLAQLTAKIGQLISAIEQAASSIANCSVAVPALVTT